MLTENSLTNTLTLSGITNIRYRVYTNKYLISLFYSQHPEGTELIKTFQRLIDHGIPCLWHSIDITETHATLELWVFWLNKKHKDIIDKDKTLMELEETHVGSFNYEGTSPSASPLLGTQDQYTTSLTREHKYFIKSIRNLISKAMVDKGSIKLGDFFILSSQNNDVLSILDDQQANESTMLACTYNTYLASSHLIFQPNTRRMRIKPLTNNDIVVKNRKVLLSPTGECAYLISLSTKLPKESQQKILEQWLAFHQLPLVSLDESLVMIKTLSNEIIPYPHKLVFLITDTKQSPTSLSGCNGVMSMNRGLTNDLGSHFMSSDTSLRAYRDPFKATEALFSNAHQDSQDLLHRVLLEPVVSSPFMNSKSVMPVTPTTNIFCDSPPHAPPHAHKKTNLIDFINTSFKMEPVESILDELNPTTEASNAIPLPPKDNKMENGGDPIKEQEIDMPMEDEEPPQEQYDFNLVYDKSNDDSWGISNNNQDLADLDLDLDVTDADFDFFETPAALAMTSNTVLNIMPMTPVIEPPNTQVKSEETVDIFAATPAFLKEHTEHQGINVSNTTVMDDIQPTIAGTNTKNMTPIAYVPKDFLPVPMSTTAIDVKYDRGGKFMYDPSTHRHHHRHTRAYSPEYVPKVKKRKIKLESVVKTENNLKNGNILLHDDVDMMDASKSPSNDDSSSSSGSSTSSYTSSDEEDEGDTMTTLEKYQRALIIRSLTNKFTTATEYSTKQMDYDTPFSITHTVEPVSWKTRSDAKTAAVSYLCQQAIWGGYPFTNGLCEIYKNGGEIKSESAQIFVARRTNLMQITHGVVTHVPSLQSETQQWIMEFKDMMSQLFLSNQDDNVTLNVKGPLNIQQYYDISTEQQQQPSHKYGKYQIKKKWPDEPNLNTLYKPDIVVSRSDDFLEGSPNMILFWEKLRLEPYSNKKNIKYVCIFPDNEDIQQAVIRFMKDLGSVYDDACHLGRHEHAGNIGPYHHGLVPVTQFEVACEEVGRCLAAQEGGNNYTVIYMMNPTSKKLSSYLRMCHCFSKLKQEYNKISNFHRLVLQLVPLDHVLLPSSFSGYSMLGIKDIAFSVYTKCFNIISRRTDPLTTCDIYSPPFVLSNPTPKKIQFKLNDIRPFPIILNQQASLHLAYCFSYNGDWMTVVWIDNRGELLEYALLSKENAYQEAWHRTKAIAKRTDFAWTIVITKIGLIFEQELMCWLKYTKQENGKHYYVAIVALDLESELNLHFMDHFPAEEDKELETHAPTFLDSLGRSVSSEQQRDDKSKSRLTPSSTQTLLLNHRVSYSDKRERAYQGIMTFTNEENWMTPLMTGYLVHHILNKTINPSMEQFNNQETFVTEIHLIYNNIPHSSYSTLQEIIKKLHCLSFVNPVPSSHCCIPFHVVLAERLSRLLLTVGEVIHARIFKEK